MLTVTGREESRIAGEYLVSSIVGVDGCGKSSASRDALDRLVSRIREAGIGL
jgi:hypothetical protein